MWHQDVGFGSETHTISCIYTDFCNYRVAVDDRKLFPVGHEAEGAMTAAKLLKAILAALRRCKRRSAASRHAALQALKDLVEITEHSENEGESDGGAVCTITSDDCSDAGGL